MGESVGPLRRDHRRKTEEGVEEGSSGKRCVVGTQVDVCRTGVYGEVQ